MLFLHYWFYWLLLTFIPSVLKKAELDWDAFYCMWMNMCCKDNLKPATHWLFPRRQWRTRTAQAARGARGRKVSKLPWRHECPPIRSRPNSASPLRYRRGRGGITQRGSEWKLGEYKKKIKELRYGHSVVYHEFVLGLRCNRKACSCRNKTEMM